MLVDQILAALDNVTAAQDRVYALILPTNTEYPSITYQVISVVPTTSIVGSRKPDHVRVQVTCWARTYNAARLLLREVRPLMEAAPFQGVADIELDNFEEDGELFSIAQDFFCWEQN
jgi:Protein of unknown function (DUF3168)